MGWEYIYVWDRRKDRCVGTWYVKSDGMRGVEPKTSGGPIDEDKVDDFIKNLLIKYPEPRYLVEGGESDEWDGEKAAMLLRREALCEEE